MNKKLEINITINKLKKIFLVRKKVHIAKIRPDIWRLIQSKKLNAFIKSKKHNKVQI